MNVLSFRLCRRTVCVAVAIEADQTLPCTGFNTSH